MATEQPKSFWNQKKSLDEHVRDLACSRVLSRQKIGVASHFAANYFKKMYPTEDSAKYFELKDALAKMCACEKLMSLSLWTCDTLVLSEALKPIHDAGIEFPTELKMALLQRRLKDFGNVRATATVEDVRVILWMVTHWQKSGLENLEFDPFYPALSAIEGSHAEKADAMLSLHHRPLGGASLAARRGGRGSAQVDR